MKIEDLNKSILEAERFLQRALEFKAAHTKLKEAQEAKSWSECSRYSTIAEQGAVKRASMDLTRSLAQLRKSPHQY